MTAVELETKQAQLHEKIKEHAKDDERLPIYDGVFDCEGYLNSSPKIMWILKEPYDEDGGGWPIWVPNMKPEDLCTKDVNPTTKVMLQTTYAIRHNLEWENIPYIQNEPQGMLEVLTSNGAYKLK